MSYCGMPLPERGNLYGTCRESDSLKVVVSTLLLEDLLYFLTVDIVTDGRYSDTVKTELTCVISEVGRSATEFLSVWETIERISPRPTI